MNIIVKNIRMIYTPVYGDNLCNLLSNKIIEEFNGINTNHITEVIVVDLQNFLVIKGMTTINNPINYSKVFSKYISDLSDVTKNFNVIDLIEYNVKPNHNIVNLTMNLNSKDDVYRIYDLSENIQGFYDVNYENKTISSNNNKILDLLLSNPRLSDFTTFKQKTNGVFMSQPIYGKNLMSEKIFETFLRYVSFNLFERQIVKDITYNLFYNGDINNISWENINLTIDSRSSIVSIERLHSLILDVFDFNPNSIKKHLSLDNYNFENEIISNDKCWKLNDKVKELILL